MTSSRTAMMIFCIYPPWAETHFLWSRRLFSSKTNIENDLRTTDWSTVAIVNNMFMSRRDILCVLHPHTSSSVPGGISPYPRNNLHIEEIFLIHVLSELAFNTVKNFLPSQAALGGERTKSWRYMSIPAKCGPTSVFHLPESH